MDSDPFSSSDDAMPLSIDSCSMAPVSTSTTPQETSAPPPAPDDHAGNSGDAASPLPLSQQEPRKLRREQPQRKPPPSASSGSFPTPFKCCGDFCGVVLQEELRGTAAHGSSSDPSLSSSGAGVYAKRYLGAANALPAATAIQMLFSQDDLQTLGDDNLSHLLTSIRVSSRSDKAEPSSGAELLPKTASSPADLHVITYKSIALAKANHDHFRRAAAASQRKTYENGASTSSNGARKRHASRLLESTVSQEYRANSRVRVYGELDGVANYYRQVRVCGDCYAIYALLDMARSLMAHHAAEPLEAKRQRKRPNKRREEWEQHVEREVQHKEQLYLRKHTNKAATGEQSQSQDLSLVLPLQQRPSSRGTATTTTGGQFTDDEDTLPVLVSPTRAPVASNSDNALLESVSKASLGLSGGGLSKNASMPALLPIPSPSGSTIEPPRGLHGFLLSTQESAYSSPSELNKKQLLTSNDTFKGMERYLRGESKQIEALPLVEGQLFPGNATRATRNQRQTTPSRGATNSTSRPTSTDISTILLVDSDANSLQTLHESLRSIPGLALEVESIVNPQEALEAAKTFPYDLILCERDLGVSQMSGLDFVRMLRQFEVQKSMTRSRQSEPLKRTPVVCVTSKTSQTDLQLYKDAGMDGCVGKPIYTASLHHTVHAALAKAVGTSASKGPPRESNAVDTATEAIAQARREQLERKKRRRRRVEAARALPSFPGLADLDARDDYITGTFQMDAETSMPYCVLGGNSASLQPQSVPNTFFNLVVIHDIFDTWEKLQILLSSIVTRYHGAIQVLVWNYPGQAYTTWRTGTLLNNAYHVQCLHALLQHVNSLQLLRKDAPYYMMGIGNGGNIALKFCVHSPPLDANTRALLLVNAFAFVDASLAQFLHDCLKVFTCTPESRPDLPVYFHTRFLFSSAYLARVSTPLALNLYTAVMNPITLAGRKALCQGALAHVEWTDDDLRRLRVPCVQVCSSQDALVNVAAQAQTLLQRSGLNAVESIGKVLRQRPSNGTKQHKNRQSCIISMANGHEIFQECKQDMLLLIEQLVTGFHEFQDAPIAVMKCSNTLEGSVVPTKKSKSEHEAKANYINARRDEDDDAASKRYPNGKLPLGTQTSTSRPAFEDAFITNVLSTVKQVVTSSERPPSSSERAGASNQLPASPENTQWTHFQQKQVHQGMLVAKKKKALAAESQSKVLGGEKAATSPSKLIAITSWDPTTPAFERLSSNIIYKIGDGSKIYPDASASSSASSSTQKPVPELKEYMAWRVKRNQKRLQRMATQARVIQRAFRAFYARTLILRIKQQRCAIQLQRLWRARLARKKYKGMKREDWAVRLVQRNWRGKLGRDSFRVRLRRYLAAIDIQRIVRGFLAVRFVVRIREKLHNAAVSIQRAIRRYVTTRRVFRQRQRRNAAMCIQRLFRGHIGRNRFAQERAKFLYSKTQSQGIAFGKQMLLEYKLYATKLQSDVALLAQTKRDVEARAEVLVKEICEFDEGIRLLESEMHTLSQVETESMAKNMDEQGKWQLREQKMRLDREFTQMLAQIALRKEKLGAMEDQLQQLDKERLTKEEELKTLERKLVVLLDEQQQELTKIKQKQQTRNQLLLDILPPHTSVNSIGTGVGPGTPGFSLSSPSNGGHGSPWTGASGVPTSLSTPASNAASAFTQQQREEANSLMESTETMMKFGFMSMSMTYFSSMNMVRAMRKIGAHHMTLDSAAAVSNKQWPEYTTAVGSNPGSPFMGSSIGIGSPFQPDIPRGSFPGQQPLQVVGWSVADVGRWLDTLALAQYKRAFADAAVDGSLLLHLNDDDLKNTLGMEHRLHRKKILTSVQQLRESERIKMAKLYGANGPGGVGGGGGGGIGSPTRASGGDASFAAAVSPVPVPTMMAQSSAAVSEPTGGASASASIVAGANLNVVVSFQEFCTLVRHGKVKQLKEALANVPDKRFDALTVIEPFRAGVGTIYDDLLEKSVFHINQRDENGNSPLLLAAQNNSLKVVQLLLAKGANPNHQNKHGNTAGHYAMAYSFFDLGAWLLDPEKGGGRDDLLNDNGLTAYDGLS